VTAMGRASADVVAQQQGKGGEGGGGLGWHRRKEARGIGQAMLK
jgi:hypothetical protein